jgi:hypothetical protein
VFVLSAFSLFAVGLVVPGQERDARWREEVSAAFDESVLGVSEVLGTPDSPSADSVWHEGPGPWGRKCRWTRQARWPLGNADPADPIGRIESAVKLATDYLVFNAEPGVDELEGASSVYAVTGWVHETWLFAGVEDGDSFRLSVFDNAC